VICMEMDCANPKWPANAGNAEESLATGQCS
jgi:hypothetical protein